MNDEQKVNIYFRELSRHELLTPEEERDFSQKIEKSEIAIWKHILLQGDISASLTEAAAKLKEPPELGPSLNYIKKDKLPKAAVSLRNVDLDRFLLDELLKKTELPPKLRAANNLAKYLRDKFIKANLRLVVTMARRYDRGGMPLEDLIQEGNLGLMHAVSRFDYRRGLRFSTYACWWIRHAIGRALADKARAVRIPVHMLEAQHQIDKIRQVLTGDLGRPPTPSELARAAKIPLSKLNQMHRYIMGQPVSIDRPVHDDDDRNLGDTIADPLSEEFSFEGLLTQKVLYEQIQKHLDQLSQIESDVLCRRFGLNGQEEQTFREIGDEYKLSRERIRQIQNSALDKLKRALEREHKGRVGWL